MPLPHLLILNSFITEHVDAIESQLIAVRRHLHQHPEISGSEYQTTQYLADQLTQHEISFQLGPDDRGIIADLGNDPASRRIAIRADIDAIPIHDSKKVEYRSRVNNVMHACGHDAHSAILLGAVTCLQHWFRETRCPGAVRAIFQPEEETMRGARQLIDWGALKGVDAILGLHVDPHRAAGTVGLKAGPVTAQCDEVLIEIVGQGGHAARPHETCDPIAAATQFLSACYALVPRAVASQHPVVLSFGSIAGGDACNVIPDSVSIKGTLRTLDPDSRIIALEKIQQIAEGVSQSTRTQFHLNDGKMVPSILADSELTDLVQLASTELLGPDQVVSIAQASMGGEDFAFYSEQLPASFVRLGCAGPHTGKRPLHHCEFDIDEKVLTTGAKVLAMSAARYMTAPTE